MKISFIGSRQSFYKTIQPVQEAEVLGYDLETSGLDPFEDTIILLSLAGEDFINVYDVRCLEENTLDYLLNLIKDKLIIAHQAKFDLKFTKQKYGILLKNVYCTMIAEAVLNTGLGYGSSVNSKHKPFYGLDELLESHLQVKMNKSTREQFIDNPDIKITPEVLEYAAEDVKYLAELKDLQLHTAEERKLSKVFDLEFDLIPVLVDMELNGIKLDRKKWIESLEQATYKAEKALSKITDLVRETAHKIITTEDLNAWEMFEYFDIPPERKSNYFEEQMKEITNKQRIIDIFWHCFNINSPQQITRMINLMGIPADNTNEKYLKMNFPKEEIIEALLDYREWAKKISTYGIDFLEHIHPKTGRVHTEFIQVISTGRFASQGPNLQNIPSEDAYRHPFVAEEGNKLVTLDYSQIEYRMLAEITRDERMIEAFNKDEDLHKITASEVFGMPMEKVTKELRDRGKSVNFAIIYRSSARGLARNFQIPYSEGKEILETFNKTYPGVPAFLKVFDREFLKRGYSVTPYGRKRFFIMPVKWSKKLLKYKFRFLREGFNNVIQGGCADLIKLAMIRLSTNNPYGDDVKLLLQVHDELVIECKESIAEEAAEWAKEEMISAAEEFISLVPVDVNYAVADYWTK